MLMLVMVGCAATLAAGESLQTIGFNQEMKINALGDCEINIDFKLNAQQYAAWNQKYGQNKSLLKRDLGKLVSQYDAYDWKIDVREMERQVMVGVKAHGVVKHNGGGRYEFPVPKNWKGGAKNGNTLEYNYIEPFGTGVVAQYQIKLVLPDTATDIKDDVGESGEPVLRYAVPVGGSHGGILLTLGIMGMVAGLGVMGVGVFGQRLPLLKNRRGGGPIASDPASGAAPPSSAPRAASETTPPPPPPGSDPPD
jgi:hypothetical protein